ncbi:MAG: DNA topoisomerase I [Candidatus Aenigmarchaeota archaeon]|nr:DNA topoisomerase I [Candidatus Aenigmarchaeota archaeon]
MSYTLIIAEKPDAARRIAESIADKTPKAVERNGVKYYEFTANGKLHVCVPAAGHLFVLDVKKNSVKGWGYPAFEYEWVPTFKRKGTEWTGKYFRNIQALVKNANEFIGATDFDNEGEVLLYNILRFICNVNDAKRMKFSTLTKDELAESYKNAEGHLMLPTVEAGLTRHYLDALWGFNLTRALTLSLKAGGLKGFAVLSTGRVQGPALAILFEKELEIRNFKPAPFWEIQLHVDADGQNVIAFHEKEKIWEVEEAKRIFEAVEGNDAVVKGMKKREFKQMPPPPFNTTELQAESYAQFGYSPRQSLDIAESLYQAGYISYPRSSSQKLPPGVGYEKIVKALGKLAAYKKFAGMLLKKGGLKPVEGKMDDPAHPSVYATHEVPDTKKLNAHQKRIYDLVARRTLAAFGELATRETSTVELDVNGNKFFIVGKRTVEPGWTDIYSPYISRDELILPELKVGKALKVNKAELLSKETQPPGRYSQGSLVKELEKRSLGTKATRAEILQTLYDRGYVTGKSMQVTKLGEAVVEALEEHSPEIVSEGLTRHFEEEMEQVHDGRKEREKVVGDAREVLGKVLEGFRKNEEFIGKKLAEGLVEARKEAAKVGRCPKCRNYLKIIRAKTGNFFVGCSGYPGCRNMYPLPRNSKIQAVDKNCETCGTPMVLVIRRWRRPFRMCLDPSCPTKASWKKG